MTVTRADLDAMFDLSGRVALVTGGSRGLGLAISSGLAAAGAAVMVSSRKVDACEAAVEAITAEGGTAAAHPAHMGDVAQVEGLVDATIGRYGRLDVVVNNAANALAQSFGEITEAGFDKSFAVNVKGPVFLVQRAIPHLAASGHGSVVNIVSVGGFLGGPHLGLYTAGKAALWHFTRTMAKELLPHGIRVNAIAPGPFDTDMIPDDEAMRAMITGSSPQNRLAAPKEIVGAALYLASDASTFATGSVVVVDGGSLA
jgi:NAD(P)-dependent dehydrogenase (short-subunit alcohol dehydrogenase family)